MYQLYQTTRSAAMSTHAALEEIGAKYELIAVDLSKPRTDEHLALNPQGKVPILVHDTGKERRVIFQSAACLLYLADQHPEAKLLPPLGTIERAHGHQWLFFMAEQLQPAYLMHFYTERFTSDANGIPGVQAKAAELVDQAWRVLDGQLNPGPYLLGKSFSICDLYMLTFAIWHKSHQNVVRTLAAVRERPAVQRMLAANGVS
jgi:glutathione S-transferase